MGSIYTGTTPSCDLFAALPGTTHTVAGQVFLRRPFHRNCILFELRTDGSLVHNTTTVLVRLGPHCSERTVVEARLVRPGDFLSVTGTLDSKSSNKGTGETRPMILCTSFELKACWKTVHPALTFTRFERLPPILGGLPPLLQLSLDLSIANGSDSAQPEATPTPIVNRERKEEERPHPIDTPILEEFWNGIPLHSLCMYHLTGQHGCRSRTCKLSHDIVFPEGLDRGELKFAFGRWRERARAHTSGLNEAVLDERVRAAFAGRGGLQPLVELTTLTLTTPPSTPTPRAVHGMRAHCFAAWVVEQAPKGLLERGVLDVAGGSGEVAFLLTAHHGVRVTTVDPRFPATGLLSQCRTRKAWAAAHPTSPFQSLHTGIRLLFGEGGEGFYWPQGRVGEEGTGAGKGGGAAASDFGLALGFHPDQATEPLLDWCLATATPFAIVPCCVFGAEAKGGRRVLEGGGSEVTSYEDFCIFLLEKCVKAGARVKVSRLPLNGRNWVIHSF
jgi:hypothetical protein